jgi:uncharacterized protein YdeI (YjbR/CyaY-like superfamily)
LQGEVEKEKIIYCSDWFEWEKWLKTNYRKPIGVWLKIAKKDSGEKTLTISEALDVALCFGWIDSKRKKCDDKYYLQRYSQRNKKSPWSKLNVERAEKLIKSNRMQKNGLIEIKKAKADGRWDMAYESQRQFEIPSDFNEILNQNIDAKNIFNSLDKTTQYAIILPMLKANKRSDYIQKALVKLNKMKRE